MSKRPILILLALITVIMIGAAYLVAPRIAVMLIAGHNGLEVAYADVRITPHFTARDAGGLSLDIYMKDVLIKRKSAAPQGYDDLAALVSAPLDGSWRYRSIKGVVRPLQGKIIIESLDADADIIKVSAKGVYHYAEDSADLDMTIRFSRELIGRMPPELSDAVLKTDQNGWGSLSVNLSGNFKSPAIQITGRLFRLNIREISGS